jgi:hypothetical protein
MKIRLLPIALVALGLTWLAADVNYVVGNVILRETWLGFYAPLLDRLPPTFAYAVRGVGGAVLFLGWIAPIAIGFRRLLRRESKTEPPTARSTR